MGLQPVTHGMLNIAKVIEVVCHELFFTYFNHEFILEASIVVSAGRRSGDQAGHRAVHLRRPRAS